MRLQMESSGTATESCVRVVVAIIIMLLFLFFFNYFFYYRILLSGISGLVLNR